MGLSKLWTPDPRNRSRFHDEKGNRIGLAGLCYLPNCLASTLRRMLTGHRAEVPWLSYRAAREFEKRFGPNSRVLEFGSGMSTLWFARHAGTVVSLESDEAWFGIVRDRLKQLNFSHVDYRLNTSPDYALAADVPDASFDLVLVDGWMRGPCAVTALTKVKPGGCVYLDNADKSVHDPDIATAEKALLEAAQAQPGRTHQYFTDFSPGFLVVHQGLLVRL